jgi:sulfate/thiosulfate transport system permease protein
MQIGWHQAGDRPFQPGNQALTRGLVLTYLSFFILLPVAGLFWQASKRPFSDLWQLTTSPVAVDAYQLTFVSAVIAATINSIFGLILAWILVRYEFPGKRLADSLVDMPFAMPGVVAGITLVSLYAPGSTFGQFFDPGTPLGNLFQAFGVEEVNLTSSAIGVLMAQIFSTLPFVVRTVQPVLVELEPDVEESAYILGASPWQTFWRVLFPLLLPAILTGFTLAMARAIGEFGIILIISGNIPGETLVATVYVFQRLEEFDYSGATAVAIVLLVVSLILLISTNLLQRWSRRYDL